MDAKIERYRHTLINILRDKRVSMPRLVYKDVLHM